MNKKDYVSKLANRIRICFYILLGVSIYEGWYWLDHGGGLSFILFLLSSAVTFFAYTLMRFFDDVKDNIK